MTHGRRQDSGHPKGYVGRAPGTTFMWLTPIITPFERYNLTFKDSKDFIVRLKLHIKYGRFSSVMYIKMPVIRLVIHIH